MSDWEPSDLKEIDKIKRDKTTAQKLSDAEDLLDHTLKEQKDIFGSGNYGVVAAGLCDGQTCTNHWVKPHGIRGCTCRLAQRSAYGKRIPTIEEQPAHIYFRERHAIVCTQNGNHEVTELGCHGFKSDPTKHWGRKVPAYMKRVFGRRVIG